MPLDWASRILAIAITLAIPSLDILSYLGWRKSLRRELPRWRSTLGLASIVITFLSWYGAMIVVLAGMASEGWVELLALLALAGIILALTLKGASRMEAIAAGLLMLVGITHGVS
jgi:hypothetical protein